MSGSLKSRSRHGAQSVDRADGATTTRNDTIRQRADAGLCVAGLRRLYAEFADRRKGDQRLVHFHDVNPNETWDVVLLAVRRC
jgi:hypothetical protein